MSIRIMTAVWESGPDDPMQRLVLLAIADHADDQGRAYPSMVGIAAKCAMTERGARGIVRKLEAAGWLDTKVGGGRGGKSHYTVNTEPSAAFRDQNPEPETRNDKPGMTNPEYEHPKTRNDTALNPEPRSAEPSRTIKEPSERARVREILTQILTEETADAFIAMRKSIKAPLTVRAAELIVVDLRKCQDPEWVTNQSIQRSWRGVFPEQERKRAASSPPMGRKDSLKDIEAQIEKSEAARRRRQEEAWRS